MPPQTLTPEDIQLSGIATAINRMAELAYENAASKGFHDKQEDEMEFMARATANLHGEVSELWEAQRNDTLHKLCDKAEKMNEEDVTPLTCAEEELADIVIRAMDTAARLGISLGISLGFAVVNKHRYNRTRSYRHGGKTA